LNDRVPLLQWAKSGDMAQGVAWVTTVPKRGFEQGHSVLQRRAFVVYARRTREQHFIDSLYLLMNFIY